MSRLGTETRSFTIQARAINKWKDIVTLREEPFTEPIDTAFDWLESHPDQLRGNSQWQVVEIIDSGDLRGDGTPIL